MYKHLLGMNLSESFGKPIEEQIKMLAETGFEAFECGDQQVYVVALTTHKVTAAEIEPFDLSKPRAKFGFKMFERVD